MAQLDRDDEAPRGRGRPRSGSPTRQRMERAASVVEYALLVSLIAVACVLAVQQLGEAGSDSLEDSNSRISVARP